MSIISNTTVLSNFAAIDALDRLRELYGQVYLSTEVYNRFPLACDGSLSSGCQILTPTAPPARSR
jgi:predicted nucleic acid-binding protein